MSSEIKSPNIYPIADSRQTEDRIAALVSEITDNLNRPIPIVDVHGWARSTLDGVHIGNSDLARIRAVILERLNTLSRTDPEMFDRDASTIFYEELKLLPTQAAEGALWESLSAFVFPDVVFDRFFDGVSKVSESSVRDRFRRGRRNALQRWWFRRRVFSEEIEQRFAHVLNQDLTQQLVERPSLSSNSAMTEAILLVVDAHSTQATNFRASYRNVLKEASYLSLLAVPQLMEAAELAEVLTDRGKATGIL